MAETAGKTLHRKSYDRSVVACRVHFALAFLLVVQIPILPARAASPGDVDAALAKAIDFLEKQSHDGNWEGGAKPDFNALDFNGGPSDVSKYGGVSALATYALLSAGENAQKPEIAAALKWLLKCEMHGTYPVALRSQVLMFMPESKERNATRERDKEFLLNSMIPQGPSAGFYGYSWRPSPARARNPAGMWYDRSNSQYAVLGMWALEQAGTGIPQRYWEITDNVWKSAQDSSGGWNYSSRNAEWSRISVTMTSAGVATLFITREMLHRKAEVSHEGAATDNIDNGLKYLSKHVDEVLTIGDFYAMHGVARVGLASGRKFFGATDWYQVGSDYLVSNQGSDGSWQGKWGKIVDTSFAILFLTSKRGATMIGKLEHGSSARLDWNERPDDAARLTKWASRSLGHQLCWRTVNLNEPISSLESVPVLLVTGSSKLTLSKDEKAALRDYIRAGGLVVGNADDRSEEFSKSFQLLGAELFPKFEFRELASTHPLFTRERFKATAGRKFPALRGLNDGDRELMLLIPDADVSLAWQAESKSKPETFELGTNIFLYAMEYHRGPEQPNPNTSAAVATAAKLTRADPSAEAKALNLVRTTYGPYPADPDKCQKLAIQFIDEANAATDDNATRYALLEEAGEIAAQAKLFDVALRAAGATRDLFGIYMVPQELEILKKAVAIPQPADLARLLSAAAQSVSRRAASARDYVNAITAADYSEKLAIMAKDDLLTREAHGLFMSTLALEREGGVVQSLQQAVSKSPDDPRANRELGKFLCLRKTDWPKGLPHLAKGDDAKLKEAAESEIACSDPGVGTFEVAGTWWSIADQLTDPSDSAAIREHARLLYAKADPNLAGVRKTLAEKRMNAEGQSR